MSDSEKLINLIFEIKEKYQIPPKELERVFPFIGLIRIYEVKRP
jgi:hypothetical protein